MESNQLPLGAAHFFAQADGLALGVLAVLCAMSIASWYQILAKGARALVRRRRSRAFLARIEAARGPREIAQALGALPPRDPFARLAAAGLAARAERLDVRGPAGNGAPGIAEAPLVRALAATIAAETVDLEAGLTLLASVASAAPFVGLFGTVAGIYHALLGIGRSGQGSLNQVAGPVGEALIMTGLGLAVAIPAVLAYNAFNRANRVLGVRLEGFAGGLLTRLAQSAREGTSAPAPTLALAGGTR